MVEFPPNRNYQPLTRAQLRKRYGPSNPLYPILETLISSDVCGFVDDDFIGTLHISSAAGGIWTVANSGGGGAANFAAVANSPNGKIRGDPGTTDDGDARLFMTSNENVTANRRPVLIGRIGTNDTVVTNSKFEFGFADASSVAGSVLVKATPTSTGTDYAVIIRDTNDSTSVDLVADGGTDAIIKVVSSPGITFAAQTWYDLMIGLNELKEEVFYIDGVYQGIARRGPDVTVTLGVTLNVTARTSDTWEIDCDFIKGWQERVPFSGNAFTT
jgi:hypothetical protein